MATTFRGACAQPAPCTQSKFVAGLGREDLSSSRSSNPHLKPLNTAINKAMLLQTISPHPARLKHSLNPTFHWFKRGYTYPLSQLHRKGAKTCQNMPSNAKDRQNPPKSAGPVVGVSLSIQNGCLCEAAQNRNFRRSTVQLRNCISARAQQEDSVMVTAAVAAPLPPAAMTAAARVS